ncbi:MAG: DUF1292 domain-containing protein [Acutalibacteraceae bacterium]|nr:DUF1292 domain-containing protein [Acutalibacteraceae bacterium]
MMSNEEYEADLITLLDDENVEHTFEIIDKIERDDNVYYALLPVYDDAQEQLEDDGEYYIFQTIEEDGEELLLEVEDDTLLDELAAIFEKHFEEIFGEDEE